MKHIIAVICLVLLPTLMFAQANNPVGDTKENGVVIFSQQSNLVQENKKFIQEFFTWLDDASRTDKSISKKDLLQYFDSHVIYTVNGKTLAFDAAHLLSRFNKLKKTYKKIDLILPVKILIVSGNHIAVHYQTEIENFQQQHYIDDAAVLITLKKQKIIAWRSVIAHHDS